MHRSPAALVLVVSLSFLATLAPGCAGDGTDPSSGVVASDDDSRYGGEPTREVREERGAVGTIDATFDVNANGAATYTVPIKVPPGIRGIEPRLSVAYSSQLEESGVLGVGFLLSGLSRIERCARTVAADGVAGSVTLTRSDRLCLDGVRLVKVEGAGDYMADRSRYRTENETWTQVEAEGTCDANEVPPGASVAVATGGPCTLSATLKNGTVVRYGELEQAVCSRLSTSQNSARTEWPITSITDPNGNRMVIQYTATGEHQCVPTAMRYTSNSAAGTNAQREVRFVYEGRALTVTAWMGGFPRTLDKRLARLETFVLGPQYGGGETMVKQYRFEYQVSPTTDREVLLRLLECDGSTCLPETALTAAAEPDVFGQPWYVDTTQMMPRRDVDRMFSGDFNGDGKLDYLTAEVVTDVNPVDPTDVDYQLNLSTPADFPSVGFDRTQWQDPEQWDEDNGLALYTTDVNADGFTDLIQLLDPCEEDPSLGGARVYMGSTAGLAAAPAALVTGFSYADDVHLGDFDGDGRGDVLTTSRHGSPFSCWDEYQGWRLFKWNGSNFALAASGTFGPEEEWNDFEDDPKGLRLHHGDFNGDGKVDFVVTKRVHVLPHGHTRWRMFLSDGNGFDQQPESGVWPHDRYDVSVGDFNGDGYSDLLLTGRQEAINGIPKFLEVQDGHMLVLSTGRTLRPTIVNPQSFTRVVDGQSVSIPWGSTGALPGRWDYVEVANFNGDDKDDVLTSFDPTEFWIGAPSDHEKRVFLALDGLSLTQATTLGGIDDAIHLLGDFNEDGVDDVLHDYLNGESHMLFSRKNDQVERIVDGIGQSIEVLYQPMLGHVYEKGSGATYPVRDYVSGRRVVSRVSRRQVGVTEPARESSYRYWHARTDLEGRGFLGFAKIRMRDDSELSELTSTYRQDYPYAGLIADQTRTTTDSACALRRTLFEYEQAGSGLPGVHGVRLRSRSEREYSLDVDLCDVETHRRTLTYKYDSYGNVVQLDDEVPGSLLRTTKTYENDPLSWRLGYAVSEEVSDGATTLGEKRFEWDGKRNLTFEGSWDDQHQKWLGVVQGYNAHGNPISSTDPKSGVTKLLYDTYQLAAGTVDQLGHVRGQKLDPRFGAEVERSDPNGNKTWLTLDGYGRTMSIAQTSPQGQTVEVQRFRLTRDPARLEAGHVSQAFSRRSWTTSEWDWKEEFRDAYGRIYRTRSRGGYDNKPIRVDYEYLALQYDRVWKSSQPYLEGDTPSATTYLYDDKKRLTRATLPDGAELVTEYLDQSRQVRRTDPLGAQSTQTLDGRGNVIAQLDGEGATTTMQYDALGRLTVTVRPGGEQTVVVYDGLGRTDRVESSITGTTSYVYDDSGHLTDEADGKGQRIARTYDELDRTLTKRYIDAGGKVTRLATFEYDDPALLNSAGQLSHVAVEDGGGAIESRYGFAYDAYGHQADVALEIDGYTFHWSAEHDPAGRLVRSVYPDGSDVRTELTPAGHVARIVLHEAGAPPGVETNYAHYTGHDARGNPAQLRHSNGVTSCFQYQTDTGLLEGARTFHTALPDPISCAQSPPGAVQLLDYTYAWDDVYNLQRIDDHLDPSRSQTFSYNKRGELGSATSPGLYSTVQYGDYGPANQLLRRGAEVFSFSPAPGKGTQVVGSSQGLSATYDANGNMVSKTRGSDAWLYHWDVADRLTQVDKNGATEATFVYDENGHRLMKSDALGKTYYVSSQYELFVPAAGGAERHTRYVRGPGGTLAQITRTGVTLASLVRDETARGLAAMLDTDTVAGLVAGVRLGVFLHVEPATVARWLGRTVVAGSLAALAVALLVGLRRRRHGGARARRPRLAVLAAGTAFAMLATHGFLPAVAHAAMTPGPNGAGVPADGVFHFHTNHIGSSAVVTDAGGAEVTRVEYEPFGRVVDASSGTDASRPKFTGKELDGTGLYYHGARYYDPELGVFISADDRLGGDPLKSASFNRYAYALNNPVTLTDPSGHFVAELIFGIAAAVAVVVGALVAGTDGKIFSDPAHAFDDFSWTRAIMGAWVGLASACLSFGLGSYATTAVSWSAVASAASDLAQGALTSAALSVVVEYAAGQREIDALLATFGTTLVTSFVSGASGALAGAAGRVAGQSKYFSQLARGLLTTAMKKVTSPHEPASITLSLWYVELRVSEDDPIQLSIDGSALASEVAMFAGQKVETWARMNGPEWDWATRSIESIRSFPDRVGLGHLGSVRDLAMMRHGSLYDVATTAILRNPYLASRQQAIASWLDQNQLRRQIEDGLDTARAAPWRLVEEKILH